MKTGTPIVLIVLAGRPLCIGDIIEKVDAVLYAWHPGTMTGPAIADIDFRNRVTIWKIACNFS